MKSDAAVVVSGDRLILRQAIVNLLDNAIKYSPVGSQILIRVRSLENGHAVLEVVDQGPGVPPEHRAHIFDLFYRVDSARPRECGGEGLGLLIARWAVEAHEGQIGVESTHGRESKLWIRLLGIRAMGMDRNYKEE